MKSSVATLDQLMEPLGGCLTADTARRLVALKPDRKLQSRIDQLSRKCGAGTLTAEEREEYERHVTFGTFVAMLKSKARTLLSDSKAG